MIDDDSYQLPMTCEARSARGWIAETTFELSTGEVKGVIFHNNNNGYIEIVMLSEPYRQKVEN